MVLLDLNWSCHSELEGYESSAEMNLEDEED
jgi:hypothetical protein